MDLFSANWWANIWAMIQSLKNTTGEDNLIEAINKYTNKKDSSNENSKNKEVEVSEVNK